MNRMPLHFFVGKIDKHSNNSIHCVPCIDPDSCSIGKTEPKCLFVPYDGDSCWVADEHMGVVSIIDAKDLCKARLPRRKEDEQQLFDYSLHSVMGNNFHLHSVTASLVLQLCIYKWPHQQEEHPRHTHTPGRWHAEWLLQCLCQNFRTWCWPS